MRATLDIDSDLYRRAEAKAAIEGRNVTELVEDGLRAVLGLSVDPTPRHRLRLPIVRAQPGSERLFAGMTQDEIHERLDELLGSPPDD